MVKEVKKENKLEVKEEKHRCVDLVPLFRSLSEENRDKVNALAFHEDFAKGQLVLSPDDEEKLLILARGSLKVYQLASNGQEQLLRVVEPGGYEGEEALFGAANENLFAETLMPSRICFLRRSDFQKLLMEHPELSLNLLKINAQKTLASEKHSAILATDAVEKRLASYLLDLEKVADSSYITLPMKMKELANFIGTTAETLSRKFKILEDERLIERDGKTIKILDLEALEDY